MSEINFKSTKEHNTSPIEGKKPFECNVCEKIFSQKSGMTRHVSSVHGGGKELGRLLSLLFKIIEEYKGDVG